MSENLLRDLRSPPTRIHRIPPTGSRRFRCPALGCTSAFTRESDLRKHSKRHSRPYGCTFAHCGRIFGSKNDWKRHENSQHHRLESWRCQVPLLVGGECSKICFRKETMIGHLRSPQHAIHEKADLDAKANQCHVAGNSHLTSFWCGFCPAIEPAADGQKGCTVKLKRPGSSEGWDERFDHIGAHFERGERMKDWRHMYVPDPNHEEGPDESEEDPQQQQHKALPPLASPTAKLDILTGVALQEAENLPMPRQPFNPNFHPPRTTARSPPLPSPTPIAHKKSQKRSTAKDNKVWYCCRQRNHPNGDRALPLNVETTPSCFMCEHQRCSNCPYDENSGGS